MFFFKEHFYECNISSTTRSLIIEERKIMRQVHIMKHFPTLENTLTKLPYKKIKKTPKITF